MNRISKNDYLCDCICNRKIQYTRFSQLGLMIVYVSVYMAPAFAFAGAIQTETPATVGNAASQSIPASSDVIITGAGDDVIVTGAGDDVIVTGAGDNVIITGAGDDVIITGAADDATNSAGNLAQTEIER